MGHPDLPPVISVVGWSDSGKTTFLEGLIRELKGRGYHVGTVKHHHGEIDRDTPGKDTWRHARAGADAVALAGSQGFVLSKKRVEGKILDEIVRLMPENDIIITEGFKSERRPKIEVRRCGRGTGLVVPAAELLALVSDGDAEQGVPCFRPGDFAGMADFLERLFLG